MTLLDGLKRMGLSLGCLTSTCQQRKRGPAKQLLVGLSSSGPGPDRSHRRAIQIVGRGLILVALIVLVAALVWDVLS